MIKNREIIKSDKAKILGITIDRTGIRSHLKDRLQLARIRYKKLLRFVNFDCKINNNLFKSIVRPTWEYPILPMATISKTNKKKFQSFQNICLRYITKNWGNATIEDQHRALKIEPIADRFKTRVKKIEERFSTTHEDLYRQSTSENNNRDEKDHYWWSRQCAHLIQEDSTDEDE